MHLHVDQFVISFILLLLNTEGSLGVVVFEISLSSFLATHSLNEIRVSHDKDKFYSIIVRQKVNELLLNAS